VIAIYNQYRARVSRGFKRPKIQRMRGAFNSTGLAIVTVMVFLHGRASAQQDADLQQQLKQLKQQYEQTTKDMQQRIVTLEQQINKQNEAAQQRKEAVKTSDEATVLAAELTAENAVRKVLFGNSDKVGAQYQGRSRQSRPMTSCRRQKRRLKDSNSNWEPSNFTDISVLATQ
jgi:hypothetical protein